MLSKRMLQEIEKLNTWAECSETMDMIREKYSEITENKVFEFSIGDKVRFRDKQNSRMEGIVIKINRKTVVVHSQIGNWGISPGLLELIQGE